MIPAPDIPGHTVTGVLGSGGFATVYRTWQVAVGRETAVKVDSRVLHTERDQRRFFREVTAAGRLSGHPHVIDVYDAGTLRDGRPYLVMELCPDGSLDDELRRGGPLSAAQVCRIGAGLADALAAAHVAGILHRDIKPANVLINRYGVVGLSDFGLASVIAASGEQSVSRDALTPAYAPPESFRAAEPAQAADLYSLAATLYALMAGRPPRFPANAKSPGVATILALHGQPVDDILGVPTPMLAILRQCLAADPARRLPSAAALRDELAALTGQPRRGQARAAPPSATAPASGEPPARSGPPDQDGPPWRSMQSAGRPLPAHAEPSAGSLPPAHAEPSAGEARPESAALSAVMTQPAVIPARGRATTSPSAPVAAETGPPGRGAHAAAAPTRRGRLVMLTAAVASGLALAVTVALIVGARFLGPGGSPAKTGPPQTGPAKTGPAGVIGTFGIATTTSHCPAASVPGAGARCPRAAECWDGLTEVEGVITASPLPCNEPHSWQTFAIGIMPSDASAFNANIVQANPTVRAVCSYKVLLLSRARRAQLIPRNRWSIQVVPPDEAAYNSGVRTYRCMASLSYNGSRTSQFGPS